MTQHFDPIHRYLPADSFQEHIVTYVQVLNPVITEDDFKLYFDHLKTNHKELLFLMAKNHEHVKNGLQKLSFLNGYFITYSVLELLKVYGHKRLIQSELYWLVLGRSIEEINFSKSSTPAEFIEKELKSTLDKYRNQLGNLAEYYEFLGN